MAFIKSEQRESRIALEFLEQSRDTALANNLVLEAIADSEKIGQLHFVMEHYPKAAVEFKRCCQQLEALPEGIDGNWEQWKTLQLEIGNCFQNMHEWREARRIYQGILNHRLCEEAIRNLANLYAWQGSPELAKELLQGLRVLRPNPIIT
jgi:tetratricopeptide (TPR) repeat protein